MAGLKHRRYPCANCPFRRDVEPGEFPAERYERLRVSVGRDGAEAHFGAPMFACHKTDDEACAGWLVVAGYQHLAVRLAVVTGDLPGECLRPGPDWPELFGSYDEMAETQGRY